MTKALVLLDAYVGQELITAADVDPLVQDILATVKGLLPTLLTLAGIFIAIKLVPALIRRFTK